MPFFTIIEDEVKVSDAFRKFNSGFERSPLYTKQCREEKTLLLFLVQIHALLCWSSWRTAAEIGGDGIGLNAIPEQFSMEGATLEPTT